jgi:hypothetical protein
MEELSESQPSRKVLRMEVLKLATGSMFIVTVEALTLGAITRYYD